MASHRVRWTMPALLFVGGMINYLDRSALSVAAPLLSRDLGIEPAALGIVFSAFFIGYAPSCFLGGWAADRYGPRLVFLVTMAVWSLFCGLTAVAYSIGFLIVIRVLFGVGEAPFTTTANKLISEWFPRREAGTAIGFANAGTPLGGAISGPIVGFMAVAYGWRMAFICITVISAIWIVAWFFMGRDKPEQHPRVTPQELSFIRSDAPEEAPAEARLPLGFYLRQPAVIATGVAFFGYAYLLYFFLSWFPSYLSMAHGLNIRQMGLVSAIPWGIGFLGLVGSGFTVDLVFRRTGRALFSAKLVLVLGLLGAAVCVGVAGLVTTVEAAVALMAIAVFCMYMTATTYWTIMLDTVEKPRLGSVGGFVHFIANCAGIVAPSLTGVLVEYGSFTAAFAFAAAFLVLGGLGVALFVRPFAHPSESLQLQPAKA